MTLVIEDLHVSFATRAGRVDALQGVNLTVSPGETLGLVGESGSGKSVTAQAVMGLIDLPGRIEAGRITWNGRSLLGGRGQGSAVWGRDIAMVFQNPMTSLNPLMTVGDQIAEGLILHMGLSRGQARDRAIDLLAAVGISGPARRIHQYPHEFSGGMRQRVMIAMGIACEPKLLIADEPTTALDVTVQAQILELLADLQARMGLAIILITHDLGVVAGLCGRVAVMYSGRIVECAPVDDIFAAPRHPYTQGLLRSTPRLDGTADRLASIDGAPPSLGAPDDGCAFRARCPIATDACRVLPGLVMHDGAQVACHFPGRVAWDGRRTA
ncbi:MAG: ABC transporter ATP-binding protein [Rhodobacteraceae bacterium]|jgi:peptide/nickel transport system ATP-binding protein|nr:ABC transporter ATP-binding protein [Paracoccaceae bacterium]